MKFTTAQNILKLPVGYLRFYVAVTNSYKIRKIYIMYAKYSCFILTYYNTDLKHSYTLPPPPKKKTHCSKLFQTKANLVKSH